MARIDADGDIASDPGAGYSDGSEEDETTSSDSTDSVTSTTPEDRPDEEPQDDSPSGENQPVVGRGEKDLDSGSAGGTSSGGGDDGVEEGQNPAGPGGPAPGPGTGSDGGDSSTDDGGGGGSSGGGDDGGSDDGITEGENPAGPGGPAPGPGTGSDDGYDGPTTEQGPTGPQGEETVGSGSTDGPEIGDDVVPGANDDSQTTTDTEISSPDNPLSNVNIDSTYSENAVANEIESKTGLERGEDFTVTYDDGSFATEYTDSYYAEQYAEQYDQRYSDTDVTAEDIQVERTTDDQGNPVVAASVSQDVREEAVVEQVDEQYPRFYITGDDVDVDRTTNDQGETVLEPSFTGDASEMITEREVADAAGVAVTDIEVTDQGTVDAKSEAAARGLAEYQAEQQNPQASDIEVTEVEPGVYRATVTDTEGDVQPSGDASNLTATVTSPKGDEFLQDLQSMDAEAEAQRRTRETQNAFLRGNYGDTQEIREEQAAQRLTEQYGFDVDESDVNVVREDGQMSVRVDQDVAEAGALSQSTGDGLDVSRTEDGFNVTVQETGSQQSVRNESADIVEGQLNTITREQQQVDQPEGEQFGDFDWSFGLGGPEDEVEQFIDSGADVSEDVTDAAGNAAGGFGRGAASLVTTPLRLPGLGLEAAETTGYIASGNSTNRTREVTHEGVERVGRATSYYVQNPVEGGTVLAGSLAASFGATAAAGRVAGSTGSAIARYSIQPGEEVARAAGARAIGVGRGGTASVAQQASSGTRTFRDAVVGAMDSRPSLSRPSAPGPRVRVASDPDAPTLEIDPDLRQALGERAASVREAPRRAAGAVRNRAQAGRESLEAVSVSDVTNRAQGGVETAVESVRGTGDRAVESVRGTASTARQEFTRAELLAEDAGYRAGVQTRETADRLASMDASDLGSGSVRGAIDTTRQQFTRAELAAEDLGYRAGSSLAAADPAGRIRGGVSRAESGVSTARQQFTRAELLAEDAGYRLGEQARAGTEALTNAPSAARRLPERGRDAVGRLQQEFTRGELAAEDLGYRAGEYTGEQVNRLVSGEMPDVTGTARRELLAARFGAAERVSQARETAGRLTDLTIQVGDVEETRLLEADVDEPAPIRSPWGDSLGIESDADDGITTETTRNQDGEAETSGRDTQGEQLEEGETTVESGDQLLRQRTGGQTETESEAQVEPISETSQRRAAPMEVPDNAAGDRLGEYIGAEETTSEEMLGERVVEETDSAQVRDQAESMTVASEDELAVTNIESEVASEAEEGRVEVEPVGRVDADTEADVRSKAALEERSRLALELEGTQSARVEPASEFFDDDDGGDSGGMPSPGGFESESDVLDGVLSPGWLSETVTTIATQGRGSPETISQSELESRPLSEQLTGELPTYEMVAGDAQTQERIEDVQNLLGGFDGGGLGGSDQQSDGWGWF